MNRFSKGSWRRRGTTLASLSSLTVVTLIVLCGAGNVPVENFTPQGPMQADLNAGGHNLTNAATVSATNFVGNAGSLTNVAWGHLTGTPTTVSGYGITNAEAALGNPSTNGYVLASTVSGTRSWVAATSTPANATLQGNTFNSLHQLATFTPAAGSVLIVCGDSIGAGSPLLNLNGSGYPTSVNTSYGGQPWPQVLSGLPRWAGIPVYSFCIGGTYAAAGTAGDPSAGVLASAHYYTEYLNGAQVGTLYGNGPALPSSLTATGSGVRYWIMAYGANNAYYAYNSPSYAVSFETQMPADCTTIHGYSGTNKIIGVSLINRPGQSDNWARRLSNWWRGQNAATLGTTAGWDYFADVENVLNDMSDFSTAGYTALNNLSYDGTHPLGPGYALYANTIDLAMSTLNTNPGASRPNNPFAQVLFYDYLGKEFLDNANRLLCDSGGVPALAFGGATRFLCDSSGTSTGVEVNQFGVQIVEKMLTAPHLSGSSAAPMITASTGAGTSSTVSVDATSNDVAGKITVTTGPSPSASATVATVTFASTYNNSGYYRTNSPYVALSPNNAAAAALTGPTQVWAGNETKTTFTLSSGTTALAASTTYVFNYHVIQ